MTVNAHTNFDVCSLFALFKCSKGTIFSSLCIVATKLKFFDHLLFLRDSFYVVMQEAIDALASYITIRVCDH